MNWKSLAHLKRAFDQLANTVGVDFKFGRVSPHLGGSQ